MLIRVPTAFTNQNLPKLIDYDPTPIKEQILSLPTLRAFHDFTDPAQITVDGLNKMSQVADLGKNGLHLTASGADQPLYVEGGLGLCPAAYFDGSNKLENANLFSGSDRLSIAALIWPVGHDDTSRIFVADATDNGPNFYIAGDAIRGYSADVYVSEPLLKTQPTHNILTADHVSGELNLYTRTGKTTGTTVRSKPVGEANIGAWTDDIGAANRYIGYLGHLMFFDQDLSKDDVARELVMEYARRKYRLTY